MELERVTRAYSGRALEYVEAVGKIEHASQEDRDYVFEWARTVDGCILDVGCGPGQWTSFLQDTGVEIEGVEPTEAFVNEARTRYPRSRFRVGRAEDLGGLDGRLGGILAWFSLIHTDPRLIHESLAEFSRCIKAGGSLALGFFVGSDGEAFDHAIVTAYYWSVDGLAKHVEEAGFTVIDTQTRDAPGERSQGRLIARK